MSDQAPPPFPEPIPSQTEPATEPATPPESPTQPESLPQPASATQPESLPQSSATEPAGWTQPVWSTGSEPGASGPPDAPQPPPPPTQTSWGTPASPTAPVPSAPVPSAPNSTQPSWGQPAAGPTWGQQPPQPTWGPQPPPPPPFTYATAPATPGGLRPMDAGEILDTGFRLWWRTLKQVAPYSFLMALPLQIILAIVTLLSRNANENPDTFLDNPDQRNAVIGGGVITVMLGLLIPIILQGALTAFFTDRMLGRDTPIRPCLTVGLKRVFPLIGVAILSGFMSALGCLALCVGFFFFVTKVGVSAPACVVERAGPLKSISRSWSLTDGRFWPVFGIVMFNLIVPAMFSQAISLAGLGALSLISEDAGIVGSLIGSTFAQAIVAPLTTAIIVVQYLELRVRKEGLDLQLAAQGLTVAQ